MLTHENFQNLLLREMLLKINVLNINIQLPLSTSYNSYSSYSDTFSYFYIRE